MESFSFGDTPELADQLLDLVLRGKKTATTSALVDEVEKSNIGDRLFVKDSKENPRAVIEITESIATKFSDVSADFAYNEGEGDQTLEFWRSEHERYFRSVGEFSEDMLVLCERFKVVEVL